MRTCLIITQVIMVVNTKVIHLSDEIHLMETMGERLKKCREAKGLSQQALADKVGLKSQGTIGNIESDTRGYGARVVAIAEVLGVSPDYLLLKAEDPAPGAQHASSDVVDLTALGKVEVQLVMLFRGLSPPSQKSLISTASDLYKAERDAAGALGPVLGGDSNPAGKGSRRNAA